MSVVTVEGESIVGPPGPQGLSGFPGMDGLPGLPGLKGEKGETGHCSAECSDGGTGSVSHFMAIF